QTPFGDFRCAAVGRISDAKHPRHVAPIAKPVLPVGFGGVTEVVHSCAEGVGGALCMLAAFALLLGLLLGNDIDTALALTVDLRCQLACHAKRERSADHGLVGRLGTAIERT